jgi:ABC-type multidrug transport system fused ATPase/permease subunit/GT2 family glycosyltransferase
VTYGTFRPDASGNDYGRPEQVAQDFHMMSQNGINAVRVYTVPPTWLLDLAAQNGLYVMVGMPWEQHVAFLDSKKLRTSIEARTRAGVRACTGHPAVLCYAIGNEIPASIVRWYGHRRVERFLHRLYKVAKQEDPTGLVTYVNFPTTEYLELPFLDFVSFNVYLEAQDRLEAYIARLQNLAGDRPLVMSEIGIDSGSNGTQKQADTLAWQIKTASDGGCAGAFVFAWTDEWHRGGEDVEDWDFGLTDRDRQPKPALDAVRNSFRQLPFTDDIPWPPISVVVCTHNGARTLRDCCEGLMELDYPHFEVIVVDDGSTDSSADIASEYGFRVIRTPHIGLGAARNAGLAAASGEFVAYIDDDARPETHWLRYLAHTFLTTDFVGVGGPNLAPAESSPTAWCVENAPGGPIHVLLDDREAEHIPGCNMAFRKSALLAVGGFDPRYRTAGDDVDICWKFQARGWKLGFSPAAMVWHHRRKKVRAYWRQQVGYGRAEALLERKWPEKYNAAGHLAWVGKLYGGGLAQTLGRSGGRIYGGVWGSAPFQSVYRQPVGGLLALPSMPEWYALIGLLALFAAMGIFWPPMLLTLPLLFVAIAASIAQAALGGAHAAFPRTLRGNPRPSILRLLTFVLHLAQPLARLIGRSANGLTPWRRQGTVRLIFPAMWPRNLAVWRETWQSSEAWLEGVEAQIKEREGSVQRGGNFDNWDLEVRGGILGSARLRMGIEEHAAGRQLARFHVWPRVEAGAVWLFALLAALAAAAAAGGGRVVAVSLAAACVLLAVRTAFECATGIQTFVVAVRAAPGVHVDASGKATTSQPFGLLPAYAAPLWKGWLLILALTLLSTILSLMQPWPLKVLVDNVLDGQPLTGGAGKVASLLPGAQSQVGLLLWVAASGILIFICASGLDALLTYSWVRTGQGMVYRLARHLFARIQRRSLLFHSHNAVGDSLSRITTDSWAVHTAADNLLFAPAHAVITAVLMVAVMLPMNVTLTLMSLLVVPFMVLPAILLRGRIRTASRARRKIESGIQSHVQRTISGISVVQAFTREEHEHSRLKEFTRNSIQAQQRSAFVASLYNLGTGLVMSLGAALILFVGTNEVLAGRLTTGGLLVFIAYLATLQAQFKTLAGVYRSMLEAAGSTERVTQVLNTNEEVAGRPGAPSVGVPYQAGQSGPALNPQYHLRLRNVTFGYERRRPVLRDFSLDVRPGQTMGIVGVTGAGKSTLASLIARLYDPWQGRVEIDGRDLRDVDLESVRDAVALTFQEPYLLPATIAENIGYGRPSATREEVEAAARAAGAHQFIELLPDGYETLLGERGATLSGGERQRISIARALLKDAPILVLDEPTAALDAETERRLIESLEHLRAGKTTIIIAHRLSTVRHADRIVVIRDGKAVEDGTHDDLMSRRGEYAHLYDLQSGHEAVRPNPSANGHNGAVKPPSVVYDPYLASPGPAPNGRSGPDSSEDAAL